VNPEQKKGGGPTGAPGSAVSQSGAGSTGASSRVPADAATLRARLDRERRRAVRAESRLAEVELALRRVLGAGGVEGVPVGELRAVLDSVDLRLAALEDELRAGESELVFLEEAQRMGRAAANAGDEEIKLSLEEARRELDEAARVERSGLPELARQRMEFEVELDRLQSLLAYRENVCDGLAEELQSGTRVTAEVIGKLADLSRGRVASVRRPPTADARIMALRRDLEAEQEQLQQTRRALEAARAEANAARQTAADAEKAAAERLNTVGLERLDREREHARLYAELEESLAQARAAEAEMRRKLQEDTAERHATRARIDALEAELKKLREQLELGSAERERDLRGQLEAGEKRYEDVEAERVRLAERISLLQAALAAKDAAEKRRESEKPATEERPRRRVLSLVHNRPAPASGDTAAGDTAQGGAEPPPVGDTLREREKEIDRLSRRWRELQDAYKGALSEFEDMRRRRDSLLRRIEAPPDAPPPQDAAPTPPPAPATPTTAPPRAPQRPLCLVLVDDDGERSAKIRAAARDDGQIGYAWGHDPEIPPDAQTVLALNLAAEEIDPLACVVALAGASRCVESYTYCARGEHGFAIGPVEYFPAPFNPEICAQRLLQRPRGSRRVLAVGEAIEALSSLREILGRARCSTAVAFDGAQALELVPLVRPNFVLVDLSLPAADAVDVLRRLHDGGRAGEVTFGAMWSRPVDADKLRHDLAIAVAEADLSADQLSREVRAWLKGLSAR